MNSPIQPVRVRAQRLGSIWMLVTDGVLDSRTYRQLRDAVIKATLDEPPAVIVDVTGLCVPSPSAWAVFTSARWHVSTWPNVPILLVCDEQSVLDKISRLGVMRYVLAFPTRETALRAATDATRRGRLRARAELRHSTVSVGRAVL